MSIKFLDRSISRHADFLLVKYKTKYFKMKVITDIYLYYSQENYTQQAIVNVQNNFNFPNNFPNNFNKT